MKSKIIRGKLRSSWKHLPFGAFKSGSKLHPHNECGICGLEIVNKSRARREAKEEVNKEMEELKEE